MIRKALDTDIPAVMAIYDAARAFMRAHGNATQWPEGTPSAEQLAADIAAGGSYVCEVDGRVVATFAFLPGPDECYDVIEDGQWRSDTPYAVLHRVASDGTVHGIAAAMFAFAKERADHLRIDTHQDNLPMQGASIKAGFERAGIVYVSDGTPRVAFDWLREALERGRVSIIRANENGPTRGYFRSLCCFESRLSQGANLRKSPRGNAGRLARSGDRARFARRPVNCIIQCGA